MNDAYLHKGKGICNLSLEVLFQIASYSMKCIQDSWRLLMCEAYP